MARRPDDRFPDVVALLEAVTTLYRQQVGAEPRPMPAVGAFTAMDYTNRGNIYDDLGHSEEALADHTRAIDLDPAYATAYTNTGVVLGNQGKLHKSLSYFEKAAQLGDHVGAQNAAIVRRMLNAN